MNEFDRLLERRLRQMLDAVVAAPAPSRRGAAQGRFRPRLSVHLGSQAVAVPVAVEAKPRA